MTSIVGNIVVTRLVTEDRNFLLPEEVLIFFQRSFSPVRRGLHETSMLYPAVLDRLPFPFPVPAGLQGVNGVGLPPYQEPARGDAHAYESHRQHANPQSSGDSRGASPDL
jgi:hypothetical protein